MAKKSWIKGAVAEGKGKLHTHLGVKAGEKIPEEKLQGALHSKDKTIRKEAQLAKTLKKFHPAAKKKSGAELLYGHKARNRKMSKMSEKLYGNSPKMERDEESGKMSVKKKAMEKKDDEKTEGEDESGSGEHLPVMVRHSMERHEAHHVREREHHMHDMSGHGDKKEMHERHREQLASLHKRHEKEMKGEEGE